MAQETDWIQKYKKVEKYQHRFSVDYNYDDIYKYYTNNYKKKTTLNEYKSLCYEFNQLLSHEIITNSLEFKMPFRMGNIRIKSNKHKIVIKDGKVDTQKMSIDWPSSHKMWREEWPNLSYNEIMAIPHKKVLVYTNDHSNGYIMKWWWDRRLSNMKNQSVYVFKAVKGPQDKRYYEDDSNLYYGRRGLAMWIKNDDRTNEYYE